MSTSRNKFGLSANEKIPKEVLSSIANGESPLRAMRQWRGHSIEDLARIAGVGEESIRSAEAGGPLVLQEQKALAISLGVSADLIPRGEHNSQPDNQAHRNSINEMGRKEVDQSHIREKENELGRKEIDRS